MARPTEFLENNTETRKAQMINDLKYICSNEVKISKQAAKFIVDGIAWEWTENFSNGESTGEKAAKGNGYMGCKYWSENALNAVYDDFKNSKRKKDLDLRKTVTHEHVIPKNLFTKHIMEHFGKNDLNNISETIINNMLVGCVVTKAEAKALDCKDCANVAKKMPEGINFPPKNEEIWSRYCELNNKCNDCNITECKLKKAQITPIKVYEIEWDFNKRTPTIRSYEKITL